MGRKKERVHSFLYEVAKFGNISIVNLTEGIQSILALEFLWEVEGGVTLAVYGNLEIIGCVLSQIKLNVVDNIKDTNTIKSVSWI